MKKVESLNQIKRLIPNFKSSQTSMVVERVKPIKKLIFLFGILFLNSIVFANNLTITNISCPSSTTIQFDIAWENSWRLSASPSNWDAVWVFVKAQICNTPPIFYNHVNLSTVSGNHSVTGGVLQVDAVTDGKGVFIHRIADGSGNITTATVVLTFSSAYTIANTNFEVIGIEMVYVPTGTFQVGDGSSSGQSTYCFGNNGTIATYTVTSEGAIGADVLRSSSWSATYHMAIAAAFPKGYNSFYCMKYEISQQQYVAFLNLLGYNQQVGRTAVVPTSAIGTLAMTTTGNENRNSIEISTPGVASSLTPAVYGNDLSGNNVYDEANDGQNIACNYLKWNDLKAYLDWAALRPMTELEYEKACRGPVTPLLMEQAWGTTVRTQAISSSINNGGQATEVSTSTGEGLCAEAYNPASTCGPLRVGFAATSSTVRITAGASYYGILDLSGNVFEQCYSIGWYDGNRYGSSFTGVLGDGDINTTTGESNAINWDINSCSPPCYNNYPIVRGGSFNRSGGGYEYLRTSDRSFINHNGCWTDFCGTRYSGTGGRGVR